MSSLQGFRCRRCRTEVLAKPPYLYRDATAWAPPILCCGLWLSRVPPDQVLPDQRLMERLPARRQAFCPGCGYTVQIVVRPEWPLVCAVCRQELEIPSEALARAPAELCCSEAQPLPDAPRESGGVPHGNRLDRRG